jgi:aspartate racemase
MKKLLGVLGGMGPMATADFFRKLIEETPAHCDEDHVPVIIYSVPQMPNRTQAIMGAAESPVPHMIAGLRALREQGAAFAAIPCNTAHFWYKELCREGGLPIIHIVDAVTDELANHDGIDQPLGLLATEATLSCRIYHDRLSQRGIRVVVNSPEERDEFVNPGIELVKRGRFREAGIVVQQAIVRLRERGAQKLVLGCTELPVAIEAGTPSSLPICIDATRALARACVTHALPSLASHAQTKG